MILNVRYIDLSLVHFRHLPPAKISMTFHACLTKEAT